MDELAGEGWEQADVDASTPAPCCGRPVTLRSLIHEFDVWNPRPWPERDDPSKPAMALGEVLGVSLRGLWTHY